MKNHNFAEEEFSVHFIVLWMLNVFAFWGLADEGEKAHTW